MTPGSADLVSLIAGIIAGQLPAQDGLPPGPETRAALAATALDQGVGPMLLAALELQGIDASDPAWDPLRSATRQAAVQYMLATSSQRQVTAALVGAGIPAIWFKGADLARTAYPRPVLRPMGDIDLLVPYPQRHAALAAVEALGYRREEAELFEGAHDLVHHYHLRGNVAAAVRLELHFRLLGYSDRFLPLEQMDWFWQHTRSWAEGEATYTFLEPEAHLLYLCAHAVLQHGVADFRLLRYLDLHQLATQAPVMDWAAIVDRAVVLGWTYAVERALAIAQQLFVTPLPAGLLAELQRRRPAYEDISLATGRQVRGTRWEGIQAQFAAMSWPARVRLAWRLALPPTAYMRWRYDVHAGWQLPLAYLYRWADVAGDIGKTLNRRLVAGHRHPQDADR